MVVIPTLWLVKLKINRIFHYDAFPYVGPSPDVNTSFHSFGPPIKSKRGEFFHTFLTEAYFESHVFDIAYKGIHLKPDHTYRPFKYI